MPILEGLTVRCLLGVLCVTALMGLPTAFAVENAVKTWEGEIVIPTYPIYPADVNPRFEELNGSIIYPYTMQDHLSTVKEDRTYRAVFLENEYLKVTCLPQIGGRIHSVFDKTTNEEMFHLNHVIKPGLIAMRGAWISGGIEWNHGPQGHTVTSYSPANVTSQENPDGSASLVVGYTSKNFRTRWNVRLTLRPGKAYLDEEIRLYNPTDGTHSYYFWNNTAFPCLEGTRFIYPMTLGTDHAGTTFFQWPIDNGRDLTWLKNYPQPTSVFAYECAFDFFGAYDVNLDRGIVQYGNHQIITGKKAWTWGQSGDGLASQAALTDDDGPYIEVQSGPLRTQADYGLLGPHEEIAWREWWYPVHGLGDGFEYATHDVAVQTYRHDADLEVRVLATGEFADAQLTVSRSEAVLSRRTADLTPATPFTFTEPQAADGPVLIRLESADGIVLAEYTSPLPVPERTPPANAEENPVDTAEEAWLQGVTAEEQIRRGGSRAAYEKALTFDPDFVPALRALAELDLESGLYDNAAARLEQALARDAKDSMSWYYLGAARLEQNRLDDAIACGYRVVAQLDEKPLGFDIVGRALMRQGLYAQAAQAFEQAVALSPRDTCVREHWLAALHASGNTKRARAEARKLLNDDPLNFVAGAIFAFARERSVAPFTKKMKAVGGELEFEFITLSLFFDDLGLTKDALTLLDAAYAEDLPAVEQVLYLHPVPDPRESPLPWYLMAYYASKLERANDEVRYLKRAKAADPRYAFPAHAEFERVLQYAANADPQDAGAHLYLGNLYAGLGRLDEAVAAWEAAAALPDASSVAYRNLGLYAWKKSEDFDRAVQLYKQAIAAMPSDQTLYQDAANILIAQDKRNEAITLLESMPMELPWRGDATVLLARTYNNVARYDDSIALLDGAYFSNWENNSQSWREWSSAHLARGKQRIDAGNAEGALQDFEAALTYPDNLGVGRSENPEEAEAYYWKGKALAALNRTEEAKAAWTAGAKGAQGSENQNEYVKRCAEALSAA